MDNEEILEFLKQTGLLEFMTTKETHEEEIKEYEEKQAQIAENLAKPQPQSQGLKITNDESPLITIKMANNDN